MGIHLITAGTLCLFYLVNEVSSTGAGSPSIYVDISCDQNWLKADNSCYLWTTDDQVTWSQARIECQDRSADLLVIDDESEQSWVSIQSGEYPTDGWWVGLSYQEDGSQWAWLDGNADTSIVQWNLEPDNYENEDCCAVTEFGKYSDDACRSLYAYICKVPRTKDEICPTPADNSRWLFLDYACYFISDPADFTDYHTWQSARSKCQNLKPPGVAAPMDLISITSGDEYRFIHNQLPGMSNSGMAVKWWTGLNDQAQESFYKWSDGSPWNASYTPWDFAPSLDRSEDQSCGLMYVGGVMDDDKCSVRSGYICEKSAVHKTLRLGCPDQWLRGGSSCYRLVNNTRATWSDARAACQKLNPKADLLKVNTIDEKYWFSHMVLAGGRGYWTGLNDQKEEGTFVWADGSALNQTYVTWDRQPDEKPNEHCTRIARDGSFSDYNCNTRGGFICQYVRDPGADCAPGWLAYKTEGCYYISSGNSSQYVVFSEVKQRCLDLAHSYDNDLQAFYLYLTSRGQLSWLTSVLGNQSDPSTLWWTGLNELKSTGHWEWITSFANPPDISLIPWNTEPNNWGGNENCAMMLPGGRYNDMPCSTKSYYICELSGSSRNTAHLVLMLTASLFYILF